MDDLAADGSRDVDTGNDVLWFNNGADVAIDYSQKDWTEQVLKATDGVGADVVLEAAAGDIGEASFQLAAPFGRIVLFGARNIHEPFAPERIQQLIYKNQSVTGSTCPPCIPNTSLSVSRTLRILSRSGN